MAGQGGVVGAFPGACTCISMRGADRPARAPPATLLHGALGIKKAALLPNIAKRTIARACLRGSPGHLRGIDRGGLMTGQALGKQRTAKYQF